MGGESAPRGDLGQAEVTPQQQGGGPLHAAGDLVLLGGLSRIALEAADEAALLHVKACGQLGDPQLLGAPLGQDRRRLPHPRGVLLGGGLPSVVLLQSLGEQPRDEQIDRQAELKQQLEEYRNTSKLTEIKDRLSNEVSELAKSGKLVESYNEKSRRSQAFEADLTQYDAKAQETVKRAIDSGILNNTNRTHEFVDMIAKLSADKGVLFDFTNNEKIKASGFAIEGKQVNGYVQGNNIAINIDSTSALNKVVGHEITHVLEGTELYTELANAVKELATTKGEYDSKLQSITKLYEGVEDANIENELTAELIGEYLFTDSEFINRLSAEKPTLFKKIFDEIKYLYKTATAGSKEAKQLEKVKKTFEEAYRQKNNTATEGGVKYSFGVTQTDINNYVDAAYKKENVEDYKKYAEASQKLISDVANEIDISGYVHALRDNDIRHIKNSHGENTNEKYPITSEDIKQIPWIVENYDKVFVKTNARGKPGIVYVKVTSDNAIYYVEAVTEEYHNEKLLVNKQMIKTGFEEIPNLHGLISAINKKEGSSQYLADLEKIRKAYVQDVKGNYLNNIISNPMENVKDVFGYKINQDAEVNEDLLEDMSYYHPDAEVDTQGNITVYHRTTKANADKIKQTGVMTAKEDALFFSSKESGYASDYGDTVVKMKIPSTELRLNDVFDGEVHFDLPLKYKNGGYSLDVSKYIVDDTKKSLSNANEDIAPVRSDNVYGEDIKLQTASSDDIAPIGENVARKTTESDVKKQTTPEIDLFVKPNKTVETEQTATPEDAVPIEQSTETVEKKSKSKRLERAIRKIDTQLEKAMEDTGDKKIEIPQEKTDIICEKCGAHNKSLSIFCEKCGKYEFFEPNTVRADAKLAWLIRHDTGE